MKKKVLTYTAPLKVLTPLILLHGKEQQQPPDAAVVSVFSNVKV